MDLMGRIGSNIKRLVEASGYRSLELFAHEHDIPKSTLSRILNSKADPKVSTLERISSALGIAVDELFKPAPKAGFVREPTPVYPKPLSKKKKDH